MKFIFYLEVEPHESAFAEQLDDSEINQLLSKGKHLFEICFEILASFERSVDVPTFVMIHTWFPKFLFDQSLSSKI